MNYDTFKQHMKRLAGEYVQSPEATAHNPYFHNWLANLPDPEKRQEDWRDIIKWRTDDLDWWLTHAEARDRALLKRWIEEELTRLVDMRDDYMNYPPTDTMIDRKAFLEMEIRRLDYLIKQLN